MNFRYLICNKKKKNVQKYNLFLFIFSNIERKNLKEYLKKESMEDLNINRK